MRSRSPRDKPVSTEAADTLADGMATRVPDAEALAIIRRGASRIVLVSDDEIAAAVRAYWTDTHNLAEGAGAAPLAAALQERGSCRAGASASCLAAAISISICSRAGSRRPWGRRRMNLSRRASALRN